VKQLATGSGCWVNRLINEGRRKGSNDEKWVHCFTRQVRELESGTEKGTRKCWDHQGDAEQV